MLDELKDVHAEPRGAIAVLVEVTCHPGRDPEALLVTRLRRPRLSRRRRAFIEYSILPVLQDTRAISDPAVETTEQKPQVVRAYRPAEGAKAMLAVVAPQVRDASHPNVCIAWAGDDYSFPRQVGRVAGRCPLYAYEGSS